MIAMPDTSLYRVCIKDGDSLKYICSIDKKELEKYTGHMLLGPIIGYSLADATAMAHQSIYSDVRGYLTEIGMFEEALKAEAIARLESPQQYNVRMESDHCIRAENGFLYSRTVSGSKTNDPFVKYRYKYGPDADDIYGRVRDMLLSLAYDNGLVDISRKTAGYGWIHSYGGSANVELYGEKYYIYGKMATGDVRCASNGAIVIRNA